MRSATAIWIRLLIALALITGACGDGDASADPDQDEAAEEQGSDADPGPNPDTDNEAEADGTSGGDNGEDVAFCEAASAFLDDDSVNDVAGFSAAFFSDIDQRLAQLEASAPDEIRGEVSRLRQGFAGADEIFARYDYDVTSDELRQALGEVDNEGMLDATANIQAHLRDECGIEPRTIDPAQVDDIIEAFGVERELAECINAELGDVANIDSAELTPELLQQPVCGTSLIAILSGGATGGG